METTFTREIVFDTETTGLSVEGGDRVVDIGCVELINHTPTGRTYQQYINPERAMSEEVVAIHGLTEEFLSDKPVFAEIAQDFLDFIGTDSALVAHNASFDIKFLNSELSRLNLPTIAPERVIDTLAIAKKQFPHSHVNLNDLCKRFHIDNTSRTFHGALLDSELLVEVYLELLGGRQPGFSLTHQENKVAVQNVKKEVAPKEYKEPRLFPASQEEVQQHTDFVKKIKNNLWGIS